MSSEELTAERRTRHVEYKTPYLKNQKMEPAKKRPFLTMVLAPIAALLALGPWIAGIPNWMDATLLALLVVLCTVGAVRFCSDGARPKGLIFYSITFAWLTVGPIYQLSHGIFAWGDLQLFAMSETISTAVLCTLTAVLALMVGYEVTRDRKNLTPISIGGVFLGVLATRALLFEAGKK